MADRYDALHVRESDGKAYFTKIGAMFPNRNGEGFTLVLDAIGAPADGQYRILLKVPQPRDDRERSANGDRQQAQQRGGQAGGFTGGPADDIGDEIPFITSNSVW